jgi:hypothetical protein
LVVAKRSPILGYNHNMMHRGLVFHVQTEDSGVDNPHIFTHLFHGGVILNTRKLVYDAEADEDVVKSLMQAQHKAMLKDLKRGKFSEKIDLYLGDNPDLLPFDPNQEAKQRAETEPFQKIDPNEMARVGTAPTVEISQPPSEVSQAFNAVQEPPTTPAAPPATKPPPRPNQGRTPTQPSARLREQAAAARPPAARQSPPAAEAPARQSPPAVPKPRKNSSSGGVVVSRPAVIVGAPPRVVGGKPAKPATETKRVRKATEKSPENLFGQGLISEKSLDEVILAYLSDDSSEE